MVEPITSDRVSSPIPEPVPTPNSSPDSPSNPSPVPLSNPSPHVWRNLPERVRTVWMLHSLITDLAIVAVCAVLATAFIASDWWGFWQALVLGGIAVCALLELATQPLQSRYAYTFCRFSIGERDLRIRKGWMFRSSVTVPFNRVQHVDTKQGPLLRRFGLMAVQVHTAVGAHAIEALDVDEAERVVATITARVLTAKEDL